MNQNLTDITFILDRSGSMEYVRAATIEGFNGFLETQKQAAGDALATLIQFDGLNPFEMVFSAKPIKEAPALTKETFVPRDATPLYDAIGQTIDHTGKRLAAMPEADRPGKVVIVILTDGEENSSHHFRHAQIADMIKHQREVYKWEFVFLGANIDAMATAASMGMDPNKAVKFSHDRVGTMAALRASGSNVATYRSTNDANALSYTQKQRADVDVEVNVNVKP